VPRHELRPLEAVCSPRLCVVNGRNTARSPVFFVPGRGRGLICSVSGDFGGFVAIFIGDFRRGAGNGSGGRDTVGLLCSMAPAPALPLAWPGGFPRCSSPPPPPRSSRPKSLFLKLCSSYHRPQPHLTLPPPQFRAWPCRTPPLHPGSGKLLRSPRLLRICPSRRRRHPPYLAERHR